MLASIFRFLFAFPWLASSILLSVFSCCFLLFWSCIPDHVVLASIAAVIGALSLRGEGLYFRKVSSRGWCLPLERNYLQMGLPEPSFVYSWGACARGFLLRMLVVVCITIFSRNSR